MKASSFALLRTCCFFMYRELPTFTRAILARFVVALVRLRGSLASPQTVPGSRDRQR